MTGSSAHWCTGQFSFSIIHFMPIPYKKPRLTFDAQIALLKSRGMSISDESKAKDYLQRIGYYRLSGYWYLLQTINPTTTWADRLKKHFSIFPSGAGIGVQQTGFPQDWEKLLLWD